MLLNNDLIWVCVPKNASYSIHFALNNSNLDIQYSSEYDSFEHEKGLILTPGRQNFSHLHIQKNQLLQEWGNKETVCITRDFVDRFVSSVEFVWRKVQAAGYTTVVPVSEIDNELIYKLFTPSIIFDIHNNFEKEKVKYFNFFQSIVKDEIDIDSEAYNFASNIASLRCQNFYKNSSKCTYEFDISELDKFEAFINSRYSTNIKVEKLNSNPNPGKTSTSPSEPPSEPS